MKKNRITIRITNQNPVHIRLSIWVNGGLICNSGGVCLRNEELEDFIRRLDPDQVWDTDGIEITNVPVK